MSQDPRNTPNAVLVMDDQAIRRALRRLAHEIIEHNSALERLVLVGIPSHGVEIARRLIQFIEEIEHVRPEFGVIDVSMHRDDLRLRDTLPAAHVSQLPLDVEGRTFVLVDDVFFTGRTTRAALDAISSYGRPARVQLAVLIDRGHRELPIRPDYVGKNLPTSPRERILVRFHNIDPEPDSVWLVTP